MAVCVKAVYGGGGGGGGAVEMKLHRVLLAGCVNYTRMNLPFGGSFHAKRLFTSVSPFSSRVGGTTRTLILCSARTARYQLKCTVPLGNIKLGLCSRSYSNVGSRCQPRGPQSAAGRKENLLQGGASWPGK